MLHQPIVVETDSIPVTRPDGTVRTLEEIIDAHIDYVLCRIQSKTLAANLLGIGRSTLYRKYLGEPEPQHRAEVAPKRPAVRGCDVMPKLVQPSVRMVV